MARSIYIFNTHDLPHRAGEMREYELDLKVTEPVGVDLLSVKPGEIIELDLRLQSVDEGVLATARVIANATGECTRCLKPISWPIDENFTELYYYEVAAYKSGGKRGGKSNKEDDLDLDEDDLSFMVGDEIDLEPAIRDAIILNFAVNPLCSEDCPGLEEKQGQNWAYLSVVESQSPADQRWAALKDFPLKN
ncbi:MAG: YceD family protein [Actinomycetota bacterium]|nr:YceD family protein [Actinomycetota bacterium]